MLKIQVASVLLALIHCSLSALIQLDATNFEDSPSGWTLQNFTQLGYDEAEKKYGIKKYNKEDRQLVPNESTDPANRRYLVLTEKSGSINREYKLKPAIAVELRFKYYQTEGSLRLLYLEADNPVPVQIAYSHDGNDNSVGWRFAEASIPRQGAEQRFTILFEATTKDPKVEPVALDSLVILFEDNEAYKRSLSYDNSRERIYKTQPNQDIVKRSENEHYNAEIDKREVQEFDENNNNFHESEQKSSAIPSGKVQKNLLKISEYKIPISKNFRLSKEKGQFVETNKNYYSGEITKSSINEKKMLELPDNQNVISKHEKSSLKSHDSSLEFMESKTIREESIDKERKKRQANDGEGSNENPAEASGVGEDNSETNENPTNAGEETPQGEGSEMEKPEANVETADSEEDPKETSETSEEEPEAGNDSEKDSESNEETSETGSNPTDKPETGEETPETEKTATEPPETDDVTPEPGSNPTDAPEAKKTTTEPESNPTNAPETKKTTTEPESKPTDAPEAKKTTTEPENKDQTDAPNPEDNSKSTTPSPEDNTEAPVADQQNPENATSTPTAAPPDVTAPSIVKNTTANPEPETTSNRVTDVPTPPTDKETTKAPPDNVTEPGGPVPIPSPTQTPPLTTTAVTSQSDITPSKEGGSTDEQEGSKEAPSGTRMWFIPVVIVILVVFGVVLFRYLQLKKRRGGYTRTGSSVHGGDYTNPTFTGDAGGRSYDSIR